MTREDFLETFLDAVREMRPKYAIPFASMVAFLHPESRQCNAYAVRPPEVVEMVNRSETGRTTQTMLMVPGDRWSSTSGFELQSNDYYERQDFWIERLAEQAAPKIAQEEADELEIPLTFDAFEKHFGGFLRSLPWFTWLALNRPIGFHVPTDSVAPYWMLDFRRRRVYRAASPPANRAGIIKVGEGILADAIAKNVVAFVHISMRMRVDLEPGGVKTDFLFWGLLSLRELGYFPIRKMATPRAIGVLWRRRAEVWSLVLEMISPKGLDEKVMGRMMSRRRAAESVTSEKSPRPGAP